MLQVEGFQATTDGLSVDAIAHMRYQIRSKTVQKISIVICIITGHNALVHKNVSLGLDTLTLTTKWNDFNSRCD